MRNKKTIIIIAIVIGIGIIGMLIFLSVRKNSSGSGTDKTTPNITLRVDPDTGEQTITDPALNGKSDDTSTITVLGLDNFIQKTNISRTIIVFTRDQIQTYGIQNLGNKYATLTIRPDDLVVSGDTATSTIRLGDTANLVNFSLAGFQSGQFRVTITPPAGGEGSTYTSPVKEYSGE